MRCQQDDSENASCSARLILGAKDEDTEENFGASQTQIRDSFSDRRATRSHQKLTATISHKCHHLIGIMRRKSLSSFGSSSSSRQHKCLLHVASICLLLIASQLLNTAQASHPTSTSSQTTASTNKLQHVSSGAASNQQQQAAASAQEPSKTQPVAQARAGLIAPSALTAEDYGQSGDDGGDLDILAGQQQIPTAQLMSAAGHLVPENFFLPGGSIPASFYQPHPQMSASQRLQLQLQQQQQLSQQDRAVAETLQQVATAARQVAANSGLGPASARYGRALLSAMAAASPMDLLAAASEQHQQSQVAPPQSADGVAPSSAPASATNTQQQNQHQAHHPLIDFNGYQLTTQPDPRDSAPQVDLLEFLNGGGLSGSASQQQAALAALQQQLIYEQQLAALAAHHNHHHNQQQQQQRQHHQNEHQIGSYASGEQQQADQMSAMSSNQQQDHSEAEQYSPVGSSAIGPDYHLIGSQQQLEYERDQQAASHSHQHSNYNGQQQQRPYGLPTKSSSREPSGMLKPLGHPKTVSSPIIDFVANNLPKQSAFEKLAEKVPAASSQPPTVFSFSSQKDPVGDKAKAISSKKRNVMRQAEQFARLAIKSFNDKFGTNLGDQTDIPFLLSTLGPLGLAQNVLFDPTLLVTLLNSAEKTYFSDVLPGPAKSVVRPVLNIFRVPNKKRDKANLLNIISYLASGGQTASNSPPSKHRQFGIEKKNNNNSNKKSRR